MDMAPSVLTMAGLTPPDYMQGRALLCNSDAEKREFLVAMRNRLDTRTQFVRAVRDKRYRYMRHFYPHRPYAPYETYQWEAPIYDRFQELALAGKLEGPQAEYAQRFKAIEQLYYRRAMGASGSPESPLMAVQKTPFPRQIESDNETD